METISREGQIAFIWIWFMNSCQPFRGKFIQWSCYLILKKIIESDLHNWTFNPVIKILVSKSTGWKLASWNIANSANLFSHYFNKWLYFEKNNTLLMNEKRHKILIQFLTRIVWMTWDKHVLRMWNHSFEGNAFSYPFWELPSWSRQIVGSDNLFSGWVL